MDGRHDGLRAVQHVVDEIARLAHHPCARRVVADHLLEQLERAAGGEALPRALDDRHPYVGIAVDGQPHVGELAVQVGTDRVEPGTVHHHAQDAGGRALEGEGRERGVAGRYRACEDPLRDAADWSSSESTVTARVALVTGAGRGLGRAHALALAAHGMRVVVNDLGTDLDGHGADGGPAQSVVAEIEEAGGMAIVDTTDVASLAGGRRRDRGSARRVRPRRRRREQRRVREWWRHRRRAGRSGARRPVRGALHGDRRAP